MSKKLINGLKYEKLTEDQLYDLSQWELVDIILAYIEDLKAKEQECEAYKMEAEEGKEINAELKAELTRANCQIADDEILQCDMREAIEGLKAENDELKKQHQADKGLITSTGKQNYQLLQEYDKLKTALTEIKEIAENGKRFAERYMITGEQKANVLTYANAILQKISECEGNDD